MTMKFKQKMLFKKPTNQLGVTLIEMLIALALGIFLLAGILQVFVGSKQSFEVISAQSAMQETGRFSMVLVEKVARGAGYINLSAVTAADFSSMMDNIASSENFFNEFNSGNGFVSSSIVTGNNGCLGACSRKTDGGVNSDSFSVRMHGDSNGSLQDCQGNALPVAADTEVRMTYFLSANNELSCQVDNGAVAALVGGVEDFQVLYGVAGGAPSSYQVTRYVAEGAMTNADWPNIVSIRIGVIARSDSTPLDDSVQNLTLLDNAQVAFNDGRSRQMFTKTIALRNILSDPR